MWDVTGSERPLSGIGAQSPAGYVPPSLRKRLLDGRWVDPEATGDDSVWRETCDSHDTFVADHEPPQITPAPLDARHEEPLAQWSILGWPKDATHVLCGQRAVLLTAILDEADYECCGTSTDPEHSMYGPIRCGTFRVFRSEFASTAENPS